MTIAAATAKGAATRELILDRAAAMARVEGLESLSIGVVAQAVSMSKSGVFAHFGSREDLQLAVLDAAAQRFGDAVLAPALGQPRGLARLRAVLANWVEWVRREGGGCLLMGAVGEYDDRPGPLRDHVLTHMRRWRSALTRAVAMAVESGELHADIEPAQLAFEIHAVMLALHHDARLFGGHVPFARARCAFQRLLDGTRA